MAFDKASYDKDFHKAAYDYITLTVAKGRRDDLKALAKQEGMTVNELLRQAVNRLYGLDLSK